MPFRTAILCAIGIFHINENEVMKIDTAAPS
jgi:hypothetical protein